MKKKPELIDVCMSDLFSSPEEIEAKGYTLVVVKQLMRIRDMYAWTLAHPDMKDRQFIEEHHVRFRMSRPTAVSDLAIIKQLLPMLASASRDWHRWRFNEMNIETYQMAKKRGDTKTMERAAASYAKYNRVDLEDEQAVPYHLILVQPFTATDDPTVLGIKPIPNLQKKIDGLIEKYRAETIDIDDVEYEEADLEENILFGEEDGDRRE